MTRIKELTIVSAGLLAGWLKMAKVEKRMRSAEEELAVRLAAPIVIPEPDPIPQW